MADNQLANRVFAATNALEQKLKRRITLAELGERVAKHLGEERATDASVVARWAKGKQTPRTREAWAAFAAALEVDPGWLTFGTGSMTIVGAAQTPAVRRVAEPAPVATGFKATSSKDLAAASKKSKRRRA